MSDKVAKSWADFDLEKYKVASIGKKAKKTKAVEVERPIRKIRWTPVTGAVRKTTPVNFYPLNLDSAGPGTLPGACPTTSGKETPCLIISERITGSSVVMTETIMCGNSL